MSRLISQDWESGELGGTQRPKLAQANGVGRRGTNLEASKTDSGEEVSLAHVTFGPFARSRTRRVCTFCRRFEQQPSKRNGSSLLPIARRRCRRGCRSRRRNRRRTAITCSRPDAIVAAMGSETLDLIGKLVCEIARWVPASSLPACSHAIQKMPRCKRVELPRIPRFCTRPRGRQEQAWHGLSAAARRGASLDHVFSLATKSISSGVHAVSRTALE